MTMKFICDLSWDTKKMLERIYKQSKHHQTRQRAKCLLLSLKGTPIKELMKIFEVTRKTIYNWFSSWEENKLLGLYERAGRGRKPKLTKEQEKQVKEWVKEDPKNLKNVQIKIEKEWDYKISKDTIKRTIKKFDMRWKRMKRGLSKSAAAWELEVKLPKIKELKEQDEKGEIDLRYFDEAGWGMRACIPMGGKKKMSQ